MFAGCTETLNPAETEFSRDRAVQSSRNNSFSEKRVSQSKTMRFPRSAKTRKLEVKNVLLTDPVNGIKSQNSQQLFSVISPVMFWVQMHISWLLSFSAFHVYSVNRHHLYEFPVMQASVSSSIWSLLPYSVSFFLLSEPSRPSPHPRHELVSWNSKARTGWLARWDSASSLHRTHESAPSELLRAAGWKMKIFFFRLTFKIYKRCKTFRR